MRLSLNQWALSGDWTVKSGNAALNKANGSIAYRFHGRDLHLVMGPAAPGTSVRFRVRSRGSRQARLTASMSTSRATALLPSSGSTS